MAAKLNAATRLAQLFRHAARIDEKTATVDGWAQTLGVSETAKLARAAIVSSRLDAMRREVQSLVDGLKKQGADKALYERHVSQLENAISPLILGQPWSNVRQYLRPETMTALDFCGHMLPDEEENIPDATLTAIRDRLRDLRDSLSDETLPGRLRALIAHHIELIEQALDEYRITGAKVFREVAHTALGEIIETQAEISKEAPHPAASKLKQAWDRVNTAADIALKAEKLVALANRFADYLPHFPH